MKTIVPAIAVIGIVATLGVTHAWGDLPTPYAADAGKHAVRTIESLALSDASGEKELIVRIYFPEKAGPFPVIVFSHGFGAGKDAFAPVARHWASHGYVVVLPGHADGGAADRIRERQKTGEGTARGGSTRKSIPGSDRLGERVRDVSAVINALDDIEKESPALEGKLDRERIGVSGHSFGAATAMLVAGATVERGGDATGNFADPRVSCTLVFSTAGTGEYGFTRGSWKTLDVPALFVTGTRDLRPGYLFEWRREPFENSPEGDKYLVVIDGANHFQFGGGFSGRFRSQAANRYSALIGDASVAFWDAFLKKKKKARKYLSETGFGSVAGNAATISVK